MYKLFFVLPDNDESYETNYQPKLKEIVLIKTLSDGSRYYKVSRIINVYTLDEDPKAAKLSHVNIVLVRE